MSVGNLYATIARISSELAGQLAPDKENKDFNYKYISADLVLQEAGKLMAKEGLAVIPSVTAEATERNEYVDRYGKQKARYDCVVELDMTIGDKEGNSHISHWLGRGNDYTVPDKAYYKAITSGHKYFLMKLFNIGAGNEDGEHDNAPGDAKNEHKKQGNGVAPPMKPTKDMIKRFHALGTEKYGDAWDDKRPELVSAITKGRIKSSTYLTRDEMSKLIEGMEKVQPLQ